MSKKIVCGVYCITNPIGERYIGSSKNVGLRFNKHKTMPKTHKKLRASFIEYGYENHIFEILTECDISDLIKEETFYQQLYDSVDNGMNNHYANSSPMKGTIMKESSKLKMIESKKGTKLNQEHKDKISKSLMGQKRGPMSDEHKRKVSEGKTGKKLNLTDEQRLAMSERLRNTIRTNGKKVICTKTGIIYRTIALAAKENNINEGTLRFWLNYNPSENKSSIIYYKE